MLKEWALSMIWNKEEECMTEIHEKADRGKAWMPQTNRLDLSYHTAC